MTAMDLVVDFIACRGVTHCPARKAASKAPVTLTRKEARLRKARERQRLTLERALRRGIAGKWS
jgi:hypothetical protein